MNKEYIRFNGDYNDISFEYVDGRLIAKSKYTENAYELDLIDSFWYRKCGISIPIAKEDTSDNQQLQESRVTHKAAYIKEISSQFLSQELSVFREFIFSKLQDVSKISIGSFKQRTMNKLEVLSRADRIGLKVPKSYIVSSKQKLEIILKHTQELIVKPMYEGAYEIKDEHMYISYTSLIDHSALPSIPAHFPPALFQEKISKLYELRVIILKDKCYTIALFTQAMNTSLIDGRKCKQEELRMAPYELPDEVSTKLIQLMNEYKLVYGAIDLIVSPNGDYIFLEINPVGQFTAYGQMCNYGLDLKMAELLSHTDE